jgi:hypothetical protein
MLAEKGLELVYGGASIGLMGAMADAALAEGGAVFGVIPAVLAGTELAHRGLTELHEVSSLHERKALMAKRADAFVALPGGFGTLDETFEILTWGQLSLHQKPIAVLNVEGFFDQLLAYLDHVTAEGLIRSEHRPLLMVETEPERLLAKLRDYEPPLAQRELIPISNSKILGGG